MSAAALVLPGSIAARTGGTIYDRRIVEGLRTAGWRVPVVELEGGFPRPSGADMARAAEAFRRFDDGATVVVDGLALGALADVARDEAARLRLIGLVHHPLADETGLAAAERERLLGSERAALGAVRGVLVTSEWTARRLRELGLVADATPILAVPPGVDAAPLAPERAAGEALRLVSVGALTPRKGYDDALRALASLVEGAWSWTIVGSLEAHPASARRTRELAASLGLAERILFAGECTDAARDAHVRQGHVLLHPARYEGFGMAIAEALARGIPVVVSTGGALVETVPREAALVFEPGDVAGLARGLRRLVEDVEALAGVRRGATGVRDSLADWETRAGAFATALEELAS